MQFPRGLIKEAYNLLLLIITFPNAHLLILSHNGQQTIFLFQLDVQSQSFFYKIWPDMTRFDNLAFQGRDQNIEETATALNGNFVSNKMLSQAGYYNVSEFQWNKDSIYNRLVDKDLMEFKYLSDDAPPTPFSLPRQWPRL